MNKLHQFHGHLLQNVIQFSEFPGELNFEDPILGLLITPLKAIDSSVDSVTTMTPASKYPDEKYGTYAEYVSCMVIAI